MKNLGRRNIKQHFINKCAVMYSTSEFVPTRWEFWRVFQSWLRRTAVYRVGQRWHSGCGNARVLSQRGCGRKYVHGAVWLFAMHLPDSCFFFNLFVFRILSLPLFPFLRGKPREGKYRTMYATIFWKADNSCKYPAQFFFSLSFFFSLFFCAVWLFRQMMPSSSSHLPALYISTPSPWQCGNHPLHSFDASIHCGNATLSVRFN